MQKNLLNSNTCFKEDKTKMKLNIAKIEYICIKDLRILYSYLHEAYNINSFSVVDRK